MPLTVFVTDGNQRPALAIVRALGRRGVRTIVGDVRPATLASASRFCSRSVTYPSPHHDPQAFDGFMAAFVAREKVDVVLPVTDVTTRAICARQNELGRFTGLAVPPLDAFETATDKAALLAFAARQGIPIPSTHVVNGSRGVSDIIGRVAYPVVVKPIHSQMRTQAGWIAGSAHYAGSKRELRALYETHDYLAAYPSLVQQRIVGPGLGLFVLFDRGQLVADFAHVRLREKPPSGGASVLSESKAVAPALRDQAVRLLGSLGWHGVAMIEYKQNARTGEPVLIEVNGRFWGSLQLAIDAGFDVPGMVCELARGRRPKPQPYAIGVRTRWFFGDVDHLFMRLFRSARSLQLPEPAPSRVRTLAEFVTQGARRSGPRIARDRDPGPFLHELREYAGDLWAGLARRVRRSPAAAGLPARCASAR
jgi:predicted ATP-grasp superfamily ATP-dependent carboligase